MKKIIIIFLISTMAYSMVGFAEEHNTSIYSFHMYDRGDGYRTNGIDWNAGYNENWARLDSILNSNKSTAETAQTTADNVLTSFRAAEINATAPLTGGGVIKDRLTLSMPAGTNTTDGHVTSDQVKIIESVENTVLPSQHWAAGAISANAAAASAANDNAENRVYSATGVAMQAQIDNVVVSRTISFNGRQGEVIPAAGDYEMNDITSLSGPAGQGGKFLASDGTNVIYTARTITWQVHISGDLITSSEIGGAWIVPQALTIEKAYIYCKTTGSSGSTIVDINMNGTTIFTTQANRPTLAYDDKVAISGTPDVTSLAEGNIVTLDIDQVATGAGDLSVALICQ